MFVCLDLLQPGNLIRVNTVVTSPSQRACTSHLTSRALSDHFSLPEVHMKSRDMILRVAMAAVAATGLLLPTNAFAQADGRITGTVLDGSGSFVQNANVTVKNEKTGEERKTTSNGRGYFVVSPLKPSTYVVRVELANFAPLEYPGMPLGAGQELALDFPLKPAGVQ